MTEQASFIQNKLHCTNCNVDIFVVAHPRGGSVLACDCHFIDRDELFGKMDEHLPESSDCNGPLADDVRGLFCHPWKFQEVSDETVKPDNAPEGFEMV